MTEQNANTERTDVQELVQRVENAPAITPETLQSIARVRTNDRYPEKPIYKEGMKFKVGVIPALREFKNNCPFRAGIETRKQGFATLLQKLCAAYEVPVPTLEYTNSDAIHSFNSSYDPVEHKITIDGKLSIITFLHEFAHTRGMDEYGAVRWSLSLFKRIYPIAFNKLVADRHCLVESNLDNRQVNETPARDHVLGDLSNLEGFLKDSGVTV